MSDQREQALAAAGRMRNIVRLAWDPTDPQIETDYAIVVAALTPALPADLADLAEIQYMAEALVADEFSTGYAEAVARAYLAQSAELAERRAAPQISAADAKALLGETTDADPEVFRPIYAVLRAIAYPDQKEAS